MTPSALASETLQVAREELRRNVRETDGDNWSPDIRRYIQNLDPPLSFPIPWCATLVQYCSDVAAQRLGVANPLDEVLREAYVQDYYSWALTRGLIVHGALELLPGDLALFSFGGKRFDHIGFVDHNTTHGTWVWTVEGNTSDPGDPNDPAKQREGGGIYVKHRHRQRFGFLAVRWAPTPRPTQ